MNTRRTLIIISYWYAPSLEVGAKRFSFLAREFARDAALMKETPA